jgi:hypothetical protein
MEAKEELSVRLENGAAERTSQLNCCRQISTNLQPASRIADASLTTGPPADRPFLYSH